MKRRYIGFLLSFWTFAVQAPTVVAQAGDLTCQIGGDSFVLDDTDFRAIEPRGITREKFASLEPNSKIRTSVCATRKLWRLLEAGKADYCDVYWRYKDHAVGYFYKSELDTVQKAYDTLPVVSEPWKNCR
jgi:hypothetical protein